MKRIKKILVIILMLLSTTTLNAENLLNRFITDKLLEYIYGANNYTIISGGYNEIEEYYPNTKIQGHIYKDQLLTIETGRDGKIKQSTFEFFNITSEDRINYIIDYFIQSDNIKIVSKNIRNNGTFNNGISIEGKLPSPYLKYYSAFIDASWDYNDFKDFFFRYLRISYIGL